MSRLTSFHRRRQIERLALVLVLVVAVGKTAHADWPHLRGPNYDAISGETDLADAWPAEGPRRLWSRDLGQGYSGFIVADGRLFTQRQTLGGQYLLCLDPDTGKTVWEHRFDWAWQPKGAYPGPYASPTWYRGIVFYASTTGVVGCVDAKTGAPRWSLNLRDEFQGKGWDFGYAATPFVEDEKVILPVGGPNASLVALHVDDGRVVWKTGSDPSSYCPIFPITLQGRRCVIGYLQNAFVLVELATGKLLHRTSVSAAYDEHSAWPIYHEPHLWLASPFRVPAVRYGLLPQPDGSVHAKPQWTSREMANDILSSVLFEGHIYGFDLRQLQASPHRPSRGLFRCLDWSTGKARWSTDQVGQASVVVADGKLFMLNDSGSLILARADPADYKELARTQLFQDEICWTPPLLWKGRLFARSPSQAVCVIVGRSVELSRGTPVAARTARSWHIDASWLLSRERDFPNDAPTWDEMTLWFTASVALVFGGASLVGSLLLLVSRRWVNSAIFFSVAFLLGLLGPNLFSTLADRCLFTWPACLYIALHVTLLAYTWAGRSTAPRGARWLARMTVAGFLLVCAGYFEMCKMAGMFIGWGFLFGFPFAFPLAWLAVRAQANRQRLWIVAAWTLLAFAVYFWSCQGLFLWKAAQVAWHQYPGQPSSIIKS